MSYKFLEEDYLAPIYAIYLLAKFREKKAFPKIMDILQLPEPEIILGEDGITEYGIKNILASTFNGDLERIYRLIEDREAFEYSRAAGINTLLALYTTNQISYECIIKYYSHLIQEGLEKPQFLLWSILACAIMNLHASELCEPMRIAFNEGLVDTDFVTLEYFENHFQEDKGAAKKEWLFNRYHIIENVSKEMSWWACFNETRKKKIQFENQSRSPKKVGRNDLCLCGSGKKFKRCCLQLNEELTNFY